MNGGCSLQNHWGCLFEVKSKIFTKFQRISQYDDEFFVKILCANRSLRYVCLSTIYLFVHTRIFMQHPYNAPPSIAISSFYSIDSICFFSNNDRRKINDSVCVNTTDMIKGAFTSSKYRHDNK